MVSTNKAPFNFGGAGRGTLKNRQLAPIRNASASPRIELSINISPVRRSRQPPIREQIPCGQGQDNEGAQKGGWCRQGYVETTADHADSKGQQVANEEFESLHQA